MQVKRLEAQSMIKVKKSMKDCHHIGKNDL